MIVSPAVNVLPFVGLVIWVVGEIFWLPVSEFEDSPQLVIKIIKLRQIRKIRLFQVFGGSSFYADSLVSA
jgi:hypothetical protein